MAKRDIVVIGASAGGVEALSALVSLFPPGLPAAVFVVQHIRPTLPSLLPLVLRRHSALSVKHAEDGERFHPGVIYIAPPDRHLLIQGDTLSVARGPKENLHRPSIDALFRSAAYSHGPRVISVILTGNLDDGSAGNWAVKRFGGMTIVQDPGEATFPDMPHNAIRNGKIDYVEPLTKIPALLDRLVREDVADNVRDRPVKREEIRIWESDMQGNPDAEELGRPSIYTCPSCSGTLWEFKEGNLTRYRCRTGHAYSIESMMADQAEALERALWIAIRTLFEKADLMGQLAKKASGKNADERRSRYEHAEMEAKENAEILRTLLKTSTEPVSGTE